MLFYLFYVVGLVATTVADGVPRLEIQPHGANVTKAVGDSLALTCKPNAQAPNLVHHMQWRDTKNRRIENTNPDSQLYIQRYHDETGLVLIFTKLTENLAGIYTCLGSYSNTEDLQASITVNTIVDITWVDAPEKQYPILGKTDRIHCEVQANPPPLVSWLRNGEPIVSDDRYVIETNGLTIQNVRESDDGIYICRAVVISTGQIQTRNIKVEVQVPPRIQPMDEVEVIEGEQASTSCSATGKPPPTYTWIKENTRENLATTDRFSMNPNTGLLIINHIELNDESYYKCVAENPAGHVAERVKISIMVKPRIYELINITSPITSNTQIICKAHGRPLPSITFRKWTNKMPYKLGSNADNHISLENEFNKEKWETYATLSFYNLNRTDDGLYECIADNKVGTAYKNGHVTVEFPPTFEKTENLPPVWSWPDQPANLSCVAESIPNATIEWRVGGITIIQETPNFKRYGHGPQSYLIVKPYNDHRFFTFYECIASNKLGQATKKIHLREAKPPNPVMQVKMKTITATSIKFEITGPISYDGPPIRAFIVQFYEGMGLNWAFAKNYTWTYAAPYILESLIPETWYTFRFAARNDVGIGPFGQDFRYQMPRRNVPETPKIILPDYNPDDEITPNTVVNSKYADRFELRWNVPHDNGELIDSYYIRYCVTQRINGEWKNSEEECEEAINQSFEYTTYVLRELEPDTVYRIELRAHNAIGNSLSTEIRVRTARGFSARVARRSSISSAAIIVSVLAASLAVMIVVDLFCCASKRAGVFALLWKKVTTQKTPRRFSNGDLRYKRVDAVPLQASQQRPVVQYNGQPQNGQVFIGKHSAV